MLVFDLLPDPLRLRCWRWEKRYGIGTNHDGTVDCSMLHLIDDSQGRHRGVGPTSNTLQRMA